MEPDTTLQTPANPIFQSSNNKRLCLEKHMKGKTSAAPPTKNDSHETTTQQQQQPINIDLIPMLSFFLSCMLACFGSGHDMEHALLMDGWMDFRYTKTKRRKELSPTNPVICYLLCSALLLLPCLEIATNHSSLASLFLFFPLLYSWPKPTVSSTAIVSLPDRSS